MVDHMQPPVVMRGCGFGWGVVGLTRRLVHMVPVPVPEDDVVPQRLTAYCGQPFEQGLAELLTEPVGAPCTKTASSDPAGQVVVLLPADSTMAFRVDRAMTMVLWSCPARGARYCWVSRRVRRCDLLSGLRLGFEQLRSDVASDGVEAP